MSTQLIFTLLIALGLAGQLGLVVLVRDKQLRRMIVLLGMVLHIILFWIYRHQMIVLFSDVPFHLSAIRVTVRHGVFPPDPFFPDQPTPLHYGYLHIAGAWMARLLGRASRAWWALGLLSFALAAITGFRFGHVLAPRSFAPYLCALIFAVYPWNGMIPDLRLVSALFALNAFLSAIRLAEKGVMRRSDLPVIGLLLGIAIGIRIFTGGLGFIGVCVVLLFTSGVHWRQRLIHVLMICGIVLLTTIPILFLILNYAGGAADVVSGTSALPATHSYARDVRHAYETYFAFIPFVSLRIVYYLLTACAVFCLWWPGGRASISSKKLRVWVLFVAVVSLLPWRSLLLQFFSGDALFSHMTINGRALNLWPPACSVAVVLCSLGIVAERFRRQRFPIRAAVVYLALLGLALPAVFPTAARLRLRTEYGSSMQCPFQQLIAGVPEGLLAELKDKTVLSDAWTSYKLQERLQTHCVVIPAGHSTGKVQTAARAEKIQSWFSGKLSDASAKQMLQEFGVEFVLINVPLANRQFSSHFVYSASEYENINWSNLLDTSDLKLRFKNDYVMLLCVNTECLNDV